MLISVVIIYLFLIFPLFVSVKIFYCNQHKKLYFALNLFSFTIVSGYVEQINEGFAIHLTENYALIVPYKSFLGIKSRIKPLKDYHFIKLKYNIDLGMKENLIDSVSIAFVLNYVYTMINFFTIQKKPYVNLNQSINVFEDKNIFNVTIDLLVIFNLLMIVLSLIKILVEKIIYEFRNKKRQNQQSS